MLEPIHDSHYLAVANGRLIPQAELRVSFADVGFMMGTTVSERLRTFQGELFLLDEHLSRLQNSLRVVGTNCGMALDELASSARRLVAHNYQLLAAERGAYSDLGLAVFVTSGTDALATWTKPEGPLVGMYTYPLDFESWAGDYDRGAQLVTVSVRQTSAENWPLAVKCRSRMHYYLAAREARQKSAGAHALLLNLDESISETPTANVLLVDKNEIVSPRRDQMLPGISLAFVDKLASEFGYRRIFRTVFLEEAVQASEILLTSTSFCLLPVATLDGQMVGDGSPGPLFEQLISHWSLRVGLDIRDQARKISGA